MLWSLERHPWSSLALSHPTETHWVTQKTDMRVEGGVTQEEEGGQWEGTQGKRELGMTYVCMEMSQWTLLCIINI